MALDLTTIKRVLEEVLPAYDVREAYLFGSYARGDNTDGSDIDLRLSCGDGLDFGLLWDMREQLCAIFGCDVDLLTASPDEMRRSFYHRIQQDEVLVYAA